jgi:hypothetical protein
MTERPYVRVRAAEAPATLAEARWEKRAEELSFGALESVRASAAKWTGTIASLLAIFAVVSLVKGPSDVTKVSGSFWIFSYETIVIFLIGVSVAVAAGATVCAALAAYGLPTRLRYVGQAVRQNHRREVRLSRLFLNVSWISALFALVGLAVAVGITWLATPDEPAAPTRTIVFTDAGVGACGQLQVASSAGTVSILEKGKDNATVVDVADVTALGTLAACPGE